jgi:outer membrane receptor for ferric coprogen and ferric-rhodotorulic acid
VNAQSKVVGGGVAGIREQGSFAVADAQLGYRVNEKLRAFLTVNNLLDRVYYVRVGSINTYNIFGEPRNFLLTLRASY